MATKTILVTGATGDTGSKVVKFLLEKKHKVKALAHRKDARSQKLEQLGAEVIIGNLLNFNDMKVATEGVDGAYFCYPVRPRIIQATAYFAQAAKENKLSSIVNMSQISAREDAASHSAQDHWIAEQIFNWSEVPVTHVRPTFFAEWLLYLAPVIAQGIMPVPFDNGRHAPVAAEDQARVIANILDNPAPHAGKVYPLYGPVELSQMEIAAEIGRALGKKIEYKHVDFDSFFEGWKSARQAKKVESHTAQAMYGALEDGYTGKEASDFLAQHLREVAIDHGNGLFAGTNDIVQTIGGVSGTTVRQFVEDLRDAFESRN